MSDGNQERSRVEAVRVRKASIGRSLLVWIAITTGVAFTAYSFVTYRATREQWRRHMTGDAVRVTDLVLESTRYAMELNRKEDLHDLVSRLGENPDIAGVRLFDKQGKIIASSDREDVGTVVDLASRECVVCHGSDTTHRTVPAGRRARVFEDGTGNRVLGVIRPIRNASECAVAGCHAGQGSAGLLGVLDVTMSLREADRRIAITGRNVWIVAGVVFVLVGLVSYSFVDRVVRRPVGRLIDGARRVADGNLNARIEVERDDEIGELAAAFNTMTAELGDARRRLTDWSRDLERKVVEKTEELSRTQRHVTQVERMASLGRLAATVAHELNNPLAGIVNYARLIERDLRDHDLDDDRREELLQSIELVRREAARSGDIVRNLLLFARPSTGGRTACDPNLLLDRAVMLVRHHFEVHRIELDVGGAQDIRPLNCDPDQIQQALVALLINAVEAMPEGGRLSLAVRPLADDAIAFDIEDTGTGIPEEVLPHIFEPFFSTKDGVHGLGLGLAVVYGIVRAHGGDINVDSHAGSGTRFTVRLPLDARRTRGGREE
jgi:two-component system NtrC family sensor kinase